MNSVNFSTIARDTHRHPYIVVLSVFLLGFGFSLLAHASTVSDARKAYQAGDLQSALNEINTVLQTEPNNISALFLKAQISSNNKHHAEAIKSYQKLIQLEPHHLEAYNNLATLYAQQGELELASKTLEDAIKTDPVYSTIHTNLRAIYMDMSQKHYRLALKLRPQDSQTQLLAINTRNSSNQIISHEVQIGKPPAQEVAATAPVAKTSNPTVLRPKPSAQALTEGAQKEIAEPKPVLTPTVTQKPASKPKPELKIAKTTTITKVKETTKPASQPNGEIKQALLAWADAWSNRDAKKYVNAYREQYATSGKTNQDWAAGRRWNFKTKKFIKIALSNISIKADGNKFRAFFRQAYESDTYKDVVDKELIFVRQSGQWKIAIELERAG